ncbi:hypothetical protein [Pseudomonas sp. R16(2017)]|uniref:hypothetical protein n=1 Tax=Pseudomonas sp. R16(2017) TaxID=1981704 RepID=UPI00159420B7|nr:hypothetical protein [Pseudomonas sp. R16(2017)]
MAIASRLAPTGSVSATHIVEANLPMICGQREPCGSWLASDWAGASDITGD